MDAITFFVCYDPLMQRDAWMMSTRLAWQRPWFRVLSLLLLACMFLVNTVFFTGMLPLMREAKTLIYHTNVYNGIDDVRTWVWVFVWPAFWTGSVLAGVGTASISFKRDMALAYGILVWLVLWSLPWMIGFFYLLSINLVA